MKFQKVVSLTGGAVKTMTKEKDSYFDIDKLMAEVAAGRVDDELDLLNNEVCRLTNGNAALRLQPISQDEANCLFGDNVSDESYYLVLTYTNKKLNNSTVRNRFAFVSYAEFYPVYVKPIKLDNTDVIKCANQQEFRKMLKKLVNEESVIRSMRLARSQTKNG